MNGLASRPPGIVRRAPAIEDDGFGRWFELVAWGCAVIAACWALLLVATIPWGTYDSYAYNVWPRLIALRGGLQLSAVGAVSLHRPLFYELEGQIWWLTGFHEWSGRLLSFLFAATLVGSLVWLSDRNPRRLRRGVALLITLLIVDLARHAFDGLTDVPSAAMLALTAAFVWKLAPSRKRTALVGLGALLAVLAKPSGLLGIVALCVALLIGTTSDLRNRVSGTIAPLAGGTVLGLAYDWTQAHRLHMGLESFLQEGVGSSIWAQKAAAARPNGLYGWDWLGRPLHVLVIFAVAYSLLRVVGITHFRSALLATPLAWTWAAFGPSFAGAFPQETAHGAATLIATLVISAFLPLAAMAPEQSLPTKTELVRLLVWALPAVVVWLVWAAYDTRLVSAAWTPLVLLVVEVMILVTTGAARLNRSLIFVPLAALIVLFTYNVYNVDNLGRSGLRELQQAGVHGFTNGRFMENVALNQFQYELDALRTHVGPHDRIISPDGRLPFFYPGRVDAIYPRSCATIKRYRAFVLLLNDEAIARNRAERSDINPDYWKGCPGVTEAASIDGAFAVFVTGGRA
jgi:hypothetical protein